jgi:hypothetical protein
MFKEEEREEEREDADDECEEAKLLLSSSRLTCSPRFPAAAFW